METDRIEGTPLSHAQERLWFLQRLDPDDTSSTLFVSERLLGDLDTVALGRAFAAVVERHESLRTRYPAPDGAPVQVPGPVPVLDHADLTAYPAEERERRAIEIVAERTRRPFDLAAGPVLRACLITLGERDHVLHIAIHHIAVDGWALGVLTGELGTFYQAFAAGGPVPPAPLVRYRDHAAEERARPVDTTSLEYWRDRLAGAPALELPTDRPRTGAATPAGGSVELRLPAEVGAGIAELARRRRCTLFMALLAAYQVLLARHSGQDDVCVGSVVSTRDRPELEGVVGLFLDTLVFRGDLSGDPSFGELLGRTRAGVLGALSHRGVPFGRLVREVAPGREHGGGHGGERGRAPLFRAQFGVHQEAEGRRMTLPGIRVEPFSAPFVTGGPHAQNDLSLEVHPTPDGLVAYVVYDADLFDRGTVERMAARFTALLGQVVAHPDVPLSRLDLLAPGERAAILARAGDDAVPYPDVTLPGLLGLSGRDPDAVAVVCGAETLTYAELEAATDRLARRLAVAGAGPGRLVALCAERSVEMLAGLLAVARTGAAYLPLDPAYPAPRLAFVLADSGADLLLTQRRLRDRLPGDRPVVLLDDPGDGVAADLPPLRTAPGPDDLAYVIYTSGSTGRPKGVAVEHRALANLLLSFRDRLGAGPGHVWLASTSLSFDISALELYLPLVTGGRVVIAREPATGDGARLARLVAEHGVTHVQATPSGWRMLLDAGFDRSSLVALAGGEALPEALAAELRPRVARLFNVYGPTETTIWSSCWEVPADIAGGVRIGRPIANTRVYVLDRWLRPVPDGTIGDLHIAGTGLARGYLGRAGLTADRFRPDPYGPPGSRMYLTGDLARWSSGGGLECLGRTDGQVKLHGHRIELGEIEARMTEHPSVGQAAVVVRAERLVAYVVPAGGAPGGAPPDPGVLIEHAAAVLPAYMVPAVVMPLGALPLTPNGKVDRQVLPDPEVAAPGSGRPPATPAERRVAAVFADVLDVEAVGADDDFFALGGHSLLAARATARLAAALGAEVAVRELFDRPTVARLAAALEDRAPGTREAIAPRPAGTVPPLSAAQERLWFLHRFAPADAAYNMYLVRRLRGPLDREALARALGGVTARHETLRTRFPEVDGAPAVVVEPPGPVTWEDVDARDDDEARRLVADRTNAPLDLADAPPYRISLVRIADDDHVLCWVIHHILGDGWSLNVVMDDLARCYAGEVLPPPGVRYGDVAAWQHGRNVAGSLEYWRRRLAGPPALDLATDRPRPAGDRGRTGGQVALRLPEEVTAALERLGKEHGATLFMTLLAAYQVLLARHTGQDDVVVGSVTAGRDRVELEDVVGNLTNTVALRGDLRGDPAFHEFLAATRRSVMDDLEHQEIPYERLIAELDLGRDVTRTPLFQTMLILHSQDGRGGPAHGFGGLSVEVFEHGHAQVKFDVSVDVWRELDGLSVVFSYDQDLFDAATVAGIADRFDVLCRGIAADPGRPVRALPLLTPADEATLRAAAAPLATRGSGTAGAELPESSVPSLIAAAAARHPDAVAVRCGTREVTYAELIGRADRLAGVLRARGVGRGDVVAVCLDRGIDAVVALLTVLRAGAAYLPLDPDQPSARLARLCADSEAVAVIAAAADGTGAGRLPPGLPVVDPASASVVPGSVAADCVSAAEEEIPARDAAYLIFTSGSTGSPKGVVVEHAALTARVRWMAREYGLGPGDQVVQFASLGFDAHVEEVYPALASGATLVLLPDGGATLPDLLSSPAGRDVTVLDLPTAYWHHLVDLVDGVVWPPALRLVILGGEQVEEVAVARWRQRFPEVRLVNTYGPTEATVIATAAELSTTGEGRPPIGEPIGETTVWLLGEDGRPVPPGAVGELYIGGAGVARGYAGRPGLTAERFVPDPFTPGGGRLYRTGDRARLRGDARYEFLGRVDDQMKIRGFRIEPGEVEARLLAHPGVGQVAVVARGDLLVAYLVGGPPVEELRRHAAESLPPHMVPGAWVRLDRLPLTANGKIDHAALPSFAPEWETAYVAPRTDAEALVAEVWAELLGLDAVGAHDDFFHLGGHSLLAVRIVARLKAMIGVEVPIRTLFARRTVADFAAAVEAMLLDTLAGLSDEEALRLIENPDK
ncbi:amino acid adenylation domain-containing protein [Microtetraspora sp. AC03309]|uniref:non-ribosomal peptide synthetase n=1 Tax=Microtetraspora sp. AC03309 TaxID=2779376 RepID=UPI001E449196|nr:non-ribosomal peptide synthetase [Microtetraspora sp. AC03309]MCC5578787.1 amino acid adenylation domain-containing protein [Microtetraspora sp. AC03309]